jgi:hypothetical protein
VAGEPFGKLRAGQQPVKREKGKGRVNTPTGSGRTPGAEEEHPVQHALRASRGARETQEHSQE